MVKILVVDDEPNIAEGIGYILRKNISEIEVLPPSYGTRDAYDKMILYRPEIVITDIRMPGEDGISFIRQLRENNIESRVIIVSGYSDFEYAQSAIRLGVEDYITKPVEEDELINTVLKVIKKDAVLEQEKQLFEINGVKINDQEMFKLVIGSFTSNGTNPQYVKRFIDILCGSIDAELTMAMEVSLSGTSSKEFSLEWKLIDDAIKERLADVPKRKYFIDSRTEFYLLGCEANGEDKILSELEHVVSDVREQGVDIFVGCSQAHDKANLEDIYNEVNLATDYRIIVGSNRIVYYGTLPVPETDGGKLGEEYLKSLEHGLDMMNDEEIRKSIVKIFSEYRKSVLSPEELQKLSLNVIFMGLRRTPCLPFDISNYIGRDIMSLDNLKRFMDIEQLQNYVTNVLLSAKSCMMNENFERKHGTIEKVKQYIDKNFDKNFTLDDLSKQFYINPYYCSQLFKKEYGVNYQTYVTNLRVKRAEKLLLETDLQIYRIGELVGYSNMNHFNRIFERINGMRPVEFRQNAANGKNDTEKFL